MTDCTVLKQGKIEKLLDKTYYYTNSLGKDEVLSMRALLALNIFTSKGISIFEYSSKRIHLEYIKLNKSKVDYRLYFGDNCYYSVSKLVYDYLDIPVKE